MKQHGNCLITDFDADEVRYLQNVKKMNIAEIAEYKGIEERLFRRYCHLHNVYEEREPLWHKANKFKCFKQFKEELTDLYHNKKMSLREIAEVKYKGEISYDTMLRLFKKFNIPLNKTLRVSKSQKPTV